MAVLPDSIRSNRATEGVSSLVQENLLKRKRIFRLSPQEWKLNLTRTSMNPTDALFLTMDIQIILAIIYGAALLALWTTEYRRYCWIGVVCSLCLAVTQRFVHSDAKNPELLPAALRFADPFYLVLGLLILNLMIAWFVIWKTGGSHASCFASFYFTLPILALLLGLPQILLYSYAGLALLAFTTTLGSRGGLLESAQHMELREQTSTRIRFLSALWVVSVINFCIALFVHSRRIG